jgi:hypothetical protein
MIKESERGHQQDKMGMNQGRNHQNIMTAQGAVMNLGEDSKDIHIIITTKSMHKFSIHSLVNIKV